MISRLTAQPVPGQEFRWVGNETPGLLRRSGPGEVGESSACQRRAGCPAIPGMRSIAGDPGEPPNDLGTVPSAYNRRDPQTLTMVVRWPADGRSEREQVRTTGSAITCASGL
jgi:hypothetical protein